MPAATSEELYSVASFILESVVFAFSEASEDVPDFEADTYLTAEVAYSGDHSGTLTMTAPKGLCQEWASMMSDELSEAIIQDTLAELTNVIAGHWVSQHFPVGENIKLNPPVVTNTQKHQWDESINKDSIAALSVDGLPLLVSVKNQE